MISPTETLAPTSAPILPSKELGWTILESSHPFSGKKLRIRSEQVRIPGQAALSMDIVERADSLIIIPVTNEGRIILVRQFRHPINLWCLGTPTGNCHDTGNLSHEEVVQKELREEIGGEAGSIQPIGAFYTNPAFTSERCYAFIAWNVLRHASPDPEPGEHIQPLELSAREVFEHLHRGEIESGPGALALHMAESHISGRGWH